MTYKLFWIFILFSVSIRAQDTVLVKIITSPNPIRELITDSYGRIYVKTTKGVFEFDGENFLETDIKLPVNETMVYYEGQITTTEALNRKGIHFNYNHKNDEWSEKVGSQFGVAKVMSNTGIYWVLSQHKFLYGFKILNNFNNSFHDLSTRGLYFDGEKLWVATYKGVFRGDVRMFPDILEYSSTNFSLFNDQLYFGGNRDVYRYDFEKDKLEVVLLENGLKRIGEVSVLVEFKGDLWIGGTEAIGKYDANGLQIKHSGLKVNNLNKIFQKLWISADQGLFYLEESNPDELKEVKGLKNVTGAFEFGEKVLLTSYHGLWEYDLKTGGLKNLLTGTPYADTETTGVLGDNAGNLWIATSEGILCLRILSGEIIRYLENYEFNRRSYLKLGNSIYFGAVQGLVQFNYEDFIKSQIPQTSVQRDVPQNNKMPFGYWMIFATALITLGGSFIYFKITRRKDFNEKINQLKDEELPEGNLTFEKMEAYILEHIDTVNVDQLRMATGMSKYAFYMGFERYFGKTPKEVIFEIKQAVAQQKRKEFLTNRKK